VLFSPLTTETAYLIDLDGRVVRQWKTQFEPSGFIYMLDNGHVLRGAKDPGTSGFGGGGAGGRLQEFDFDGSLVWDFVYNQDRLPHHDVAILPNGDILAIAWERKTAEQARRAGRREEFIPPDGVWPDMLIEFKPQPPNGARVVWEWHSWDHLVRSEDAAAHPERIDVNGDLIGVAKPPKNPPKDIFHTNSVKYNARLDQIMVSVPRFNEIWVIDHSTTTAEAAGSTGGRSGKGGDLLYRWGNPQTYRRGSESDRMFGFQHDARWIEDGLPGAGHISVFSDRTPGPQGPYTKVYEFVPPVDSNGRYKLPAKGPYGPAEPVWTYSAKGFDASYISGAQRLANGNTFVSSGPKGRLFEVTPAGEIVWEYWSPYRGDSASSTPNDRANPYSLFRGQKLPPDYKELEGRDLQAR
jgi:Arylsulfotransferase (ASST)